VLKEKLGDYYEGEINHGRLYPNLEELVEMGLIDEGEIDERTNKYTLTEEGEEAIREQRVGGRVLYRLKTPPLYRTSICSRTRL